MSEEKKVETVELLGKILKVVKKPSDRTETLVMSESDYADVLNAKGVTKEMRDKMAQVDNELLGTCLKFASERLLAANKGKKDDDKDFTVRTTIQLGRSDGALEASVTPHKVRTGKDPTTQKPYEKHIYGGCTVGKICNLAREVRTTTVVDIQDAWERRYGVKK